MLDTAGLKYFPKFELIPDDNILFPFLEFFNIPVADKCLPFSHCLFSLTNQKVNAGKSKIIVAILLQRTCLERLLEAYESSHPGKSNIQGRLVFYNGHR